MQLQAICLSPGGLSLRRSGAFIGHWFGARNPDLVNPCCPNGSKSRLFDFELTNDTTHLKGTGVPGRRVPEIADLAQQLPQLATRPKEDILATIRNALYKIAPHLPLGEHEDIRVSRPHGMMLSNSTADIIDHSNGALTLWMLPDYHQLRQHPGAHIPFSKEHHVEQLKRQATFQIPVSPTSANRCITRS